MPLHKEIFASENHIVHAFEYADASARIGATGLTVSDINKMALQQDDNSLWLLVDNSPVTWEPIGGGSAGGVNDHGNLSGLNDDDHSQYLTELRHDALPADNPHSVTAVQVGADPAGTASAAISDHESSGSAHPSESITYDNATSGLSATDVQEAIDEIEARVDTNDAKISADGSINTHSDVDVVSIAPSDGHGLVFDGSNWVPGFEPFTLSCARSSFATDIWLRGNDGIPLNLSPFRIPFDAKLIAIAATTSSSSSWECEVHTNAIVRAGGTPSNGTEIAQLVISSSNSDQIITNVDLSSGDEIGVFCRGTFILRPHVVLYLVRRA